MSEGTRNTRPFLGASGGGFGSASYRDGIGSPRYSGGVNTGILDEQVLSLVFRSINWDPQAVCTAASVSRRLRAVAERVLWRELCVSRAPRMVASLTAPGAGVAPTAPPGRVGGGWPALAKLLSFCCGAAVSAGVPVAVPGHLTRVSRFSKTSGRSFLARRCRGDLLYVSDPCEHAVAGPGDEDVGAYRGVFRWFMRSRTRACLLGRNAALDPRVRCPYCGARVWNMVAARLVPRSAWRRMGSREAGLEYYVCVSGHVHGSCWLAHLTSSEDGDSDDDGSGTGDDDDVAP
ncbi:EID1-like F-box protein 3 [Brachypodium distachyon]|uniref:F-box domain-containing protein n=1 Tax=Brachypodium distachyon TaxID=15368 RepID=A0A0Q3GGJ1_BRADI|nr:EID1-like F-box protein 3 [Brachypodium distachyon]KQK10200.1 hypothetical protein BRADI_2g52630v3 [Brachypodium distachyon]|eukprot:XP_003567208.1 EID1-like F-box protein 3 [Brachypodium distachyon]